MNENQEVSLILFFALSVMFIDIGYSIIINIIQFIILFIISKILCTDEEQGRLSIIYTKLQLYSFKIFNLGFDCYILNYPNYTYLPKHKDKVNGKHYRININLKGNSQFICEKSILATKLLNIFRADKYEHSLVVYKNTYKLSFGFAILKQNNEKNNNISSDAYQYDRSYANRNT